MKRSVCTVVGGVLIAVATLWSVQTHSEVATSKHNLSVSGPGTVKAVAESETCVFCHTPHNAAPAGALWNRRAPGTTYTPYTSSTARGNAGQPNGASLLCLSCHDGTIALGELLSRAATVAMSGGVTTMPSGPGRTAPGHAPARWRALAPPWRRHSRQPGGRARTRGSWQP